MTPEPSEPLRILIVRIGAMGDVLHAMPAVAGLRQAVPGCRIGWAVEPRWEPLLRGSDGNMPLVDRVHLVATKRWQRNPLSTETVREIAALRRELRAERYDLCFDLQGSMKSGVVGRLAGASRFVGPLRPREMPAGLFYTDNVSLSAENVIGQACELLTGGLGIEIAEARVSLPVDEAAEQWRQAVWRGTRIAEKPCVVLVPTAGWGAKEWGTERFAELAARLCRGGCKVLLNKGPGSDQGMFSEIANHSGARPIECTLPRLVAMTRRASLVVGGDTGPVHLAAALGRPVVALFGPTDPRRNGPYFPGASVRVIRNACSVTNHKRVADTEAGLAAIRVEEVFGACLEMLALAAKEQDG